MVYGYKLSHSKQKSKGWLWYKNIAHCTSLILQFNQASRERIFYWLCEINNLKKTVTSCQNMALNWPTLGWSSLKSKNPFNNSVSVGGILHFCRYLIFSNCSFFISRPSSVVDAQLKYTNTTTIIYLSIYHY